LIELLLLWIIWVPNGSGYEEWQVVLVEGEIQDAIAFTMPNHKTIYIEAAWYPFTFTGCDVLRHELAHISLGYLGYSSAKHHGIMRVQGSYC